MDFDRPIAVVGAGIAGLTAALALAARGFEVDVLERAPVLDPVGAGIQLSPNAVRVLDALCVGTAVRVLGTAADHVLLRSGRTGRILRRIPVKGRDGTGYVAIHRADLQSVLETAARGQPRITLALDSELVAIGHDGADRILAIASRGTMEERRYPLVVAADGVHSRTATLLGLAGPIPSGRVALRWLAEDRGREAPGSIEAWLGPSRHAVAYPVAGGTATNIVAIVPQSDEARSDVFDRWDPRLRALIADATPVGRWPLLTTPADRPAAADHIVLIGDAAHAMLPYAAQGAAMAIEDAAVLAHHLSRAPDAASALASYDDERIPRLAKVRARVAFHQRVYHLPMPFALGRNLVLALRSEQALAADLAWLYDWRPPLS